MTLHDILESVRRIEIRTCRLVNDTMVGAFLSHFKGRGMDFEELREYVPGDDVRDIDWNVTYRMGRPFVKRFREERELGVVLAVDVSGSSEFGSADRTKREFAAEVAATLAFSAARNGDKTGLLLFTDRAELFVPPRKGRRHILRIIRELLAFRPSGVGTDIPGALAFLNHVLHRRSIIFLLTDFLHSTGEVAPANGRWRVPRPGTAAAPEESREIPAAFGHLESRGSVADQPWAGRAGRGGEQRSLAQEVGLTNARHDLVCVHLHDAREAGLPPAGLVTIEDAETGELLELDSGRAAVRRLYAEANTERLTALDRTLDQAGVDTVRLNTAEPFAQVLQRFFENRRTRLSRR